MSCSCESYWMYKRYHNNKKTFVVCNIYVYAYVYGYFNIVNILNIDVCIFVCVCVCVCMCIHEYTKIYINLTFSHSRHYIRRVCHYT